MTEAEDKAGVSVDPALDWHDEGCVKRYGAIAECQCACEKRRAATVSEPFENQS